MPKRRTKDTTPPPQAEDNLGTIRVTRRPEEVAPVEGPSTPPKTKRVSARKKVKVEEKAPPKDVLQSDITAALQELNSGIKNLTNVIERGMKLYASTLGISPQAFTDDAVLHRESYRLIQEHYTARQQDIPREESGGETFGEEPESQNPQDADDESSDSQKDQLMSSPHTEAAQ